MPRHNDPATYTGAAPAFFAVMVALSALMKDDMGHQSHNENMGNDVFVSAFNQVTDILFAVTALKPLRDADVHAGLFYAAVAIFAANVLARAAAVA